MRGRIDGARAANLALALIVGLCVGAISGYLVGGFPPPTASDEENASSAIPYPEALSIENAWIVADFSCPEPACTNTLLACQGDLPRRIRTWVNEQLANGRPGGDIRAAIIRQHGERLNKPIGKSPE